MAMLAEPRRKRKIGIDPRGMNWVNDDDKIGQKMLEKMGWSKGKGLGANEAGIVQPVISRVKKDMKGVGCSKRNEDDWISHQDDFNTLLSELNSVGGQDEVDKKPCAVSNMEEKSKKSKGRIHFKKFARGKDLSAAKAEDLACIFGNRKTPSANNSTVNSDAESITEEVPVGVQHVTSSINVADYFAEKMAKLKTSLSNSTLSKAVQKGSDVDSSEDNTDGSHSRRNLRLDSESDMDVRPSFSIGRSQDSVENSTEDADNMNQPTKKTKKKKKKKSRKVEKALDDAEEKPKKTKVEVEVPSGDGQQSDCETTRKMKCGKKSKKRKHDVEVTPETPDKARKKSKKCKKHKKDVTQEDCI